MLITTKDGKSRVVFDTDGLCDIVEDYAGYSVAIEIRKKIFDLEQKNDQLMELLIDQHDLLIDLDKELDGEVVLKYEIEDLAESIKEELMA